MADSYRSLFFHFTWSTKNREPFFSQLGKKRVYGYIKKMVEKDKLELVAIGGTSDHIHILIRTDSFKKMCGFIRRIKTSSSNFVNREAKTNRRFQWQKGEGSFTISASDVEQVKHYILNQEEHHKNQGFAKELKILSKL